MPSFFNSVGSIQSTIQNQIARSAAFMGVDNFGHDFDDLFSPVPGAWLFTGSGPIVASVTKGPGVWEIPNVAGSFMGKDTLVVANGAVTPWHVAARVRLPTVFAPDDDFGIMLAQSPALTNFVRVGTHWNVNKEHYIFEVCKGGSVVSVLSDIFVEDTLFADLELWFDGINVYGNVNDANIKLVCAAADCPTTELNPYHGVIATNNVGGNMALIDWVYSASGRTPS